MQLENQIRLMKFAYVWMHTYIHACMHAHTYMHVHSHLHKRQHGHMDERHTWLYACTHMIVCRHTHDYFGNGFALQELLAMCNHFGLMRLLVWFACTNMAMCMHRHVYIHVRTYLYACTTIFIFIHTNDYLVNFAPQEFLAMCENFGLIGKQSSFDRIPIVLTRCAYVCVSIYLSMCIMLYYIHCVFVQFVGDG